MVRIPQYGIHNGIKYNKNRTIVKLCTICKTYFIPKGNRAKVCSDKCRTIKNTEYTSYWYNGLDNEDRARIRARQERQRMTKLDTHEQILREMKELGLR